MTIRPRRCCTCNKTTGEYFDTEDPTQVAAQIQCSGCAGILSPDSGRELLPAPHPGRADDMDDELEEDEWTTPCCGIRDVYVREHVYVYRCADVDESGYVTIGESYDETTVDGPAVFCDRCGTEVDPPNGYDY